MEKMKNMWSSLKPSLKIFIVIAAGILIYALVNNMFN
tara:strand:- start:221 stop:331 length:111 start_codon:yes stop_codon:yes gene_type:complete